jgi:hypothetical protein
MCDPEMLRTKHLYSVFRFMALNNESLKLRVWNLLRRWIIKTSVNYKHVNVANI